MRNIYLDSTVLVSNNNDKDIKFWTIKLFEEIIDGNFKIIYSPTSDIETIPVFIRIKNLLDKLPVDSIEYVDFKFDISNLAYEYFNENFEKINIKDCMHYAIATFYNVDSFISWKLHKEFEINSLNYKYGYKNLRFMTPKEIIEYKSN